MEELQPGIDQDTINSWGDLVHSMAENLKSSLRTCISS